MQEFDRRMQYITYEGVIERREMILKEFIEKHKTPITLSIIILILTALNLYMLFLLNTKEEEEIEPIIEPKQKEEIKLLKVDIKGEVVHPGLYEVNKDSRVMDIIEKAGGLTNNADTSLINLSKKVKDEMVILIYSKNEVKKLKEKPKENEITCPTVNDACINKELLETLNKNDKKQDNNNQKISINTATIEELQTLTGIGEAKANAIIEYRNNQGKFEKIEDIQNVQGIGPALYEKIKDNITI